MKRLRHGDRRRRDTAPEYHSWHGMVQRCVNTKYPSYGSYGGRGIEVHADWRGDRGYQNFLSHIGRRPSPAHSVDRIDNERGYEPGNVRWATAMEQGSNKRNNRWIEADGLRLSLSSWARRLGVTPAAIKARIAAGMTEQQAVLTPPHPSRGKFSPHIEHAKLSRASGSGKGLPLPAASSPDARDLPKVNQ